MAKRRIHYQPQDPSELPLSCMYGGLKTDDKNEVTCKLCLNRLAGGRLPGRPLKPEAEKRKQIVASISPQAYEQWILIPKGHRSAILDNFLLKQENPMMQRPAGAIRPLLEDTEQDQFLSEIWEIIWNKYYGNAFAFDSSDKFDLSYSWLVIKRKIFYLQSISVHNKGIGCFELSFYRRTKGNYSDSSVEVYNAQSQLTSLEALTMLRDFLIEFIEEQETEESAA